MSTFDPQDLDTTVTTDKGTSIFGKLLLTQYEESPNFLGYSQAFIDEMDEAFEQTERVYLGRFLEFAEGAQLDVLGEIVGISRELKVEDFKFGFDFSLGGKSFSTTTDSSLGEVFNTLNPGTVVLTDTLYTKAIRAKAMCNGAARQSAEFMYEIVTILLGESPAVLKLEHETSIVNYTHFGFDGALDSETFGTTSDSSVGGVINSPNTSYSFEAQFKNKVILTLGEDTEVSTLSLINSFKEFFIPAGYKFDLKLI